MKVRPFADVPLAHRPARFFEGSEEHKGKHMNIWVLVEQMRNELKANVAILDNTIESLENALQVTKRMRIKMQGMVEQDSPVEVLLNGPETDEEEQTIPEVKAKPKVAQEANSGRSRCPTTLGPAVLFVLRKHRRSLSLAGIRAALTGEGREFSGGSVNTTVSSLLKKGLINSRGSHGRRVYGVRVPRTSAA